MAAPKTVFMFSGQGSQYFGMGHALFVQDPVFRSWMVRMDGIVRELSGNSVIEELYSEKHGKGEPFSRTLFAHPAIFMVEYALSQSLIHRNVVPDMTLGASLGSFVAATVAGFVDVEDALTAVIGHATTLEACCEPGGMIAVLAEPSLYETDFLRRNSELAGVNFATHFVVSSRQAQAAEIEMSLRSRGVAYQRLPVSFAFHSQWIDPAQAPFESVMSSIRCKMGQLPMMCCEGATMLSALPNGYFWRVARRPIRFREAIKELDRLGANRYIDVGPAGTLATFLKYGEMSSSGSSIHSILTPYGQESKNLAKLFAA